QTSRRWKRLAEVLTEFLGEYLELRGCLPPRERRGCVPPDTFRWNGREVSGMFPLQYRLLEALTNGEELCPQTPVSEVIRRLYDPDDAPLANPRRALYHLRARVQSLLDRSDVPILIYIERGFIWLAESGPA